MDELCQIIVRWIIIHVGWFIKQTSDKIVIVSVY